MTPSAIGLQRLAHQQIAHTHLKTPAEVTAWLGAMQGQDYVGALWAVGLRLPHATNTQIEQAILDETIIRTWVMRGTLHLVAAEDARWMVELLAARVLSKMAARHRELEIDAAVTKQSNDLLAHTLRDRKQHTRKELFAVLEAAEISTKGQRGVHLLQCASYAGLICQGVQRRNDPTFMALHTNGRKLTRDESVVELVRRYFTSHGPSTEQEFASWSGLTLTDTRAGLDAIKSDLVSEKIDGQTYWQPPTSPKNPSHSVYLLPGFDEYILGYRDRSAVLEPQYNDLICPGGNGVFKPTIISDGQVVGTWKRAVKKGGLVIEAEPFTSLTAAETEAFQAAAQRYAVFMEMPLM